MSLAVFCRSSGEELFVVEPAQAGYPGMPEVVAYARIRRPEPDELAFPSALMTRPVAEGVAAALVGRTPSEGNVAALAVRAHHKQDRT